MRMARFFSLAALLACASISYAQLPVTMGLELWLDATDADTLAGAEDGDFVDEWNDKSGNDYVAFATESSPEYVMDGLGGLPSVRFYGDTADGMEIDGLSLERPYTTFIVNQYWGDIRGRTLQSQDINWLAGLWNGEVSHFANGWVTTARPAAEVEEPYVVEAHGFDNGSGAYINGGNWSLDPGPTGVPGALAIAGAGQFPDEVSDADVSEIVIFNRNLETEELESMRTYFFDKYSIDRWDDNPDALDPNNIPDPDEMMIFNGEVTTFRTAEDLDFTGNFIYGINVGGPDTNDFGDPLVIGDVELVAGTNEDELDLNDIGVTMTVANQIPDWFNAAATDFGEGTEDDDNLGFALQSIRWNTQPGIDVTMEVEEGKSYKLQALMGEACCDRGFDVVLEDELMVDNLIVQDLQDNGINDGTSAVAFSHEFIAGDDELNFSLTGLVFGTPDNNPILHVLTLEEIDDLPPPAAACDPGTGGDIDGDGSVGFSDFLVLSANFGQTGLTGESHLLGDIDCNGDVAFADFLALSSEFGNEVGAAAVPEPSSFALIAIATIIGGSLRRRRAQA